MQTADGILKMRATMIEKYGSEKAWKQHLASIGSKGGSVIGKDSGFAKLARENPKKHRELASQGGRNSSTKKSIDN